MARRERAPARRRHAREGRDEPAARLRQLPRQARGSARGARRGAEDRRVAVRGVRRAFRGRAGRPRRDGRRVHARADARARPRLLHADDMGVHRADGRTRTRRSRAAAATTASSRRSVGRRRPASGSAPGSSGCCIAMEERASQRSRRRSTSSSRSTTARRVRTCSAWLAELRAGGCRADTDYAGRSLKGQLTQAGGSARRRPSIVGAGRRRSAPAGRADEPLAHAEIVGRLSGMTLARSHVRRASRAEHVGTRKTLAGWAARRRDHGGLVFVDLRDRTGITQLVINPEHAPEAAELAKEIRNEFVLQAEGEVVARAPETVNPNMPRARSSCRSTRSRSSPARRRCRSSSTRRTSTRRCASATAGSTCVATSCSETSVSARRWWESSAGTWRPPGSSTSRRRSCTSRRPRAPATSSCRAGCTRAVSSRCRRARSS